jgi:PAS domain S-box-containing protein
MNTLERNPTVLAVNDTPEVLELLRLLLTHEGYQVVSADNGRSALEIAISIEPDIVISDVVMPEMDGLEFCRRLKQDKRTRDVPVLLVSAVRTADEDSLHGLVAGADDYLEMPFRRQELLVKVARLTERHRVERHYREIVEQAADIIYTRDAAGRITSINEAGARFFGRPVSELIGTHLAELLGEDAAAVDIKNIQELESDAPLRSVHRLKDAQGVPHYLEAMLTIVRDAAGKAVGVRGVVRDITERKEAEEALRQSEEKFRAQYKGIPVPTYSWQKVDHDFVLIDYNDAAKGITRGRIEQFVGTTASELYPDRPDIIEDMSRCFDEKSVIKREMDYTLRATNENRHLNVHYVFVPPDLVMVHTEDITERKQAEAALRESEERYRQMFQNNQAIKLLVDPETLQIVDASPAACGYYGYSIEEFKQKKISDINTLPEKQVSLEMGRALNEERNYFVFRHRLASGEIRNVEVHASPIRDGQRRLIYSIIHDITERKEAEEALRESEERFRSAVDYAAIGMALVAPDGRWLQVNRSLCEIVGYTEDELLASTFQAVTHPDDLAADMDHVRQMLNGEIRTYQMEKRYIHKRGHVVWITLNVSLVRDSSGNPLYFISQVQDVTERKEAEKALAGQVGREALINRISSAVHRSLDLTEIFQTAVRELGSHLNVDRCLLFMQDMAAGMVRTVAEYRQQGVRSAARDYELPHVKDLIAGIRQYGVLAFNDAATDERIRDVYEAILRPVGVRSIMYVAIHVGDETPGCFAISTTREVRPWREEDIALARAVADQTGIAVRQAELYEKAEATSAREALINRLSLAIRASLSLPEVLNSATHELGRALGASRVHLHLYDPKRSNSQVEHEYVAPHAKSIKHLTVSYDDPLGQFLLHSSEPLVIDDAFNYTKSTPGLNTYLRSHAQLTGLRSQINYPLIVKGRFRGVLCIHQTDRVRRWMEDEIALVEAVASQLATGIAQAEMFELTKRAKKEWETTFDAMSDGIFIFDNNGQLIRVNRAGAAMEDTWPHLLLGRHCCDILRSGDEEGACIVEKSISEGRSVTLELRPERINRPLLVTVEPVLETENNTIGAVCTARDLSELRKVEAMARERQSLLTNILESVREPICAIDPRGSFLWCNTATEHTGGYRPEDLIGHHFLEIIYPADREMAKHHFEHALEGEPQSYEVRYLTRDGDVRYALFDNAPLIVEGRTTGVLAIARDITEQKQQRQRAAQADKLRALGQLASGVAHDFNNALAAVLGRAQLMRRQTQEPAMVRNLDIIQTAAEDAAATVRRIQTFARQSQVKEFELLDASSLLRDAVEITRTRWENEARIRGLHYKVELNADSVAYVPGAASELREVFVNLIVNAIDAMPQGGRLLISCTREEDRVQMSFRDTGTGMTEDVREKIFEPFYTTKGAHGTGLGLAVSYGIIERHEGSINVESELGKGTTFMIDLPAAEPGEVAEDKHEEVETPSLSVLVIDDEAFVRDTLADMLNALKHRVVTAESGREALERLASNSQFDLVFTDLSMPEMDGWEVAREIRRRWPELKVVLVTGYGKGTQPPTGEKNLIDGVIGKPFDFRQVGETIAKVTQNQVVSSE